MSAEVLTRSVLEYINRGAYPESEDAASAQLTPDVLGQLFQELQTAQKEVQNEISSLSRENAPDVDKWIARAKELQADILRSRQTAREIVAGAEAGAALHATIEDASNKVQLLENEVRFNETLTGTLELVQKASRALDRVQDAAVNGQVEKTLERLDIADVSVQAINSAYDSNAYGLLRRRADHLWKSLEDTATKCWDAIVHVDAEGRKLTVRPNSGNYASAPNVGMETIVKVTKGLGNFGSLVEKLGKDIERTVVRPRLDIGEDVYVRRVVVEGDSLTCTKKSEDMSYATLFEDLKTIISFVDTHVPSAVGVSLSRTFIPPLILKLEEDWLESAVPLDLDNIPDFLDVLDLAKDFNEQIDGLGWHGVENLKEWVENAPRTWLTKRREAVLSDVRSLVFTGLRERIVVERVETQMVSKDDAFVGKEGGPDEDEWNTAWDEPEEVQNADNADSLPTKPQEVDNDDDEDASAWELDGTDEADDENGDETDAWGWDDSEETPSQQTNSPGRSRKEKPPADNEAGVEKSKGREITLREKYTVTAIPDGLVSLLQQIILDAERLAGPDFASSPIAPTSSALYTLPTLALAIYRATAPTAYSKLGDGNMLIYNDTTRLSEQLRAWQASQSSTSRLRVDNDVKALDEFAKRAYSTEMDSQRTILNDLLDGAQGFSNCSAMPFKTECEGAIEQAVDRVREVHRQWKYVLSQSALLQSIGSLLAAVTGKMIIEIEDLPDISEADSKELRVLCDQASSVKDLFLQDAPDGTSTDMTFIYCPNWLKFQYLGELMESSLADIKYLWNDGELSLEFDGEEVVGLMEALFAESNLRRQAIAEIRRRSAR